MKKLLLTSILLMGSLTLVQAQDIGFRKYAHVQKFYAAITLDAIAISKKHHLPAAALLAIAGLESGYGSGYVAQITGNILSLGAFKSDAELPALYLPYSKSLKKVLFDPNIINKHKKEDLSYRKRDKSYKRDYRPSPYAGSHNNLELLKYDTTLRDKAYYACLNDFATRWIVKQSNIKAFREARKWLDTLIKENKTNDILYSMNANTGFIYKIGGIPHSFNYRATWPKKVELIMHKTRLVELVNDIENNNMNFKEAWSN